MSTRPLRARPLSGPAPVAMPRELDPQRLLRRALQITALLGALILVVVFAPGLGEVREKLEGADPAEGFVGFRRLGRRRLATLKAVRDPRHHQARDQDARRHHHEGVGPQGLEEVARVERAHRGADLGPRVVLVDLEADRAQLLGHPVGNSALLARRAGNCSQLEEEIESAGHRQILRRVRALRPKSR